MASLLPLQQMSRYAGSAARVVKAATGRRTQSKVAITLTSAATQRVKDLLNKQPEMKALKVSGICTCLGMISLLCINSCGMSLAQFSDELFISGNCTIISGFWDEKLALSN